MNLPTLSHRPRRLRSSRAVREIVRETRLSPRDLIYPLFIVDGSGIRREVASMPGVYQLSVDQLDVESDDIAKLGLHSVIVFGIPSHKDAQGSGASDPSGPVAQAIAKIKARHPQMIVVADVCLCEYTDHGHCGLIGKKGEILNDDSLPLLAKAAVAYAAAGADIIAPSDMMDGRVAAIRQALDIAGHVQTPIMSYAVKQASAFYGPFRDAAQSAPQFGDRKSYQMDAANAREAIVEADLDWEEGADILMVKPAMSNLDLIRALYERFHCPIAAYQVSGEYAMIKAAAARGWLDERAVALESLTAIKRAGAGLIITYFAKAAAQWLSQAEG